MRYFLFLLMSIGLYPAMMAQNLESHRWEHRLIIISTSDLGDTEYLKQIRALRNEQTGLKERKLIVYTMLKNHFASGLYPSDWKSRNKMHDQSKSVPDFRLELIGLDGGVKLRRDQLVTVRELWTLIDGMPMRRAEAQNKSEY